jgi:voltage-gated potassium channel
MGNRLDLIIEEAQIGSKFQFVKKSLIDSQLRQEFGVIIVAIKKLSGGMIINPMPLETLQPGDVIVLIDKKDDFKRMNETL